MEKRLEEIEKIVNEKHCEAVALSDAIWEFAEIRFDEYKSAEAIINALEKEGFAIKPNIAGIDTAFEAVYGNGSPVIAFLGEYDALANLNQESGKWERSVLKEGAPGHGCGHNLLGAGAYLAAVALKEYMIRNNIEGTVKYYGCPGEEGGSGKTYMARDNAFSADIAFTWHPSDSNRIFATSSLANIQAYFRFKGKAAHAAGAPENGRSALDAAELMNVGANFLREHVPTDARFHYAITNSGGNAPNVVQAEAELLYLVRSPKIDQTKAIFDRVVNIAKGAALMTDTEVEVIFDKACSNYLPNTTLSNLLYENMLELGAPDFDCDDFRLAEKIRESLSPDELNQSAGNYDDWLAIEEVNKSKALADFLYPYHQDMAKTASPGSTDVGDASWVMPTAQLYVATMPRHTSAHTWQWVSAGKTPMAHKGMKKAAEIMAAAAAQALENPDIIQQARQEFEKTLKKTPYENPIPAGVRPNKIKKG